MEKETAAEQLLKWYDKNGRNLPWRVKGGAHPSPYVILVSELMLQQTTVKTVIPYFEKFMKRFPTIKDLAIADEEEVLQYWQGLGYYSRARSLHKTAQMIFEKYNGIFPQKKVDVLKLKGIGPYTAASFLALAFNLPETVVDGNVVRIVCRLFHLTQPVNQIKDIIRQKAESLNQTSRAADYSSAIMDLGALICTPKNPQCLLCPWQDLCQSKNELDLEQIPKIEKIIKKEQKAKVFVIVNNKNELFIRKRMEKGLLFGMYEFPWGENVEFANAQDSGLTVTHVFTHIKLVLQIYTLKSENVEMNGNFTSKDNLKNYPMSTLMKKVLKMWSEKC